MMGPLRRATPPHVPKLRVLDLFSGIGGFTLGLEATGGFETVAFCEIDPFCRRVLAKHWPGVPVHEDVTKLRGEDVGAVDAICGGFPCQDISTAGKGAGLAGERSGLWREYARLVGELRPQYVLVENVAALLGRGLGDVLGDLAALGYDAEWHCIPASAVGAPHRRDRVWIVAYPESERRAETGRHSQRHSERLASSGQALGHANGPRLPLAWSQSPGTNRIEGGGVPATADWWAAEPDVGRVAHGVPERVDRLQGLGNAVLPQIPEAIGNAILAAHASMQGGEART